MASEEDYIYSYVISFNEGKISQTFNFTLDAKTLLLKEMNFSKLPDWTLLENQKCEHCPLDPEKNKYCPIAKNLAPVIERFKDLSSFEQVDVTVKTPERDYHKQTTLQRGVYSMMGLLMATSGCPHMDIFKIMARFHLPFSTFEETYYRSLSYFLLRRFFKVKTKEATELDISGMKEYYEPVQKVNEGIVKRMRSLGKGDADENALVLLHVLADQMHMSMNDEDIEAEFIENFFR